MATPNDNCNFVNNEESGKNTDNYKQHNQTDLYKILGIEQDATQEEIKQKYNELLLLCHPDKGGDPQEFRDLQIAYKILSNPTNREIYTKSLSSTFVDITKEYRDPLTGKYRDIGYEITLDDFTKGTSIEEKHEKRQQFMKKFDESRTQEERQFIDN